MLCGGIPGVPPRAFTVCPVGARAPAHLHLAAPRPFRPRATASCRKKRKAPKDPDPTQTPASPSPPFFALFHFFRPPHLAAPKPFRPHATALCRKERKGPKNPDPTQTPASPPPPFFRPLSFLSATPARSPQSSFGLTPPPFAEKNERRRKIRTPPKHHLPHRTHFFALFRFFRPPQLAAPKPFRPHAAALCRKERKTPKNPDPTQTPPSPSHPFFCPLSFLSATPARSPKTLSASRRRPLPKRTKGAERSGPHPNTRLPTAPIFSPSFASFGHPTSQPQNPFGPPRNAAHGDSPGWSGPHLGSPHPGMDIAECSPTIASRQHTDETADPSYPSPRQRPSSDLD